MEAPLDKNNDFNDNLNNTIEVDKFYLFDEDTKTKNLKAKLPLSAYLFFPKGENLVSYNEKNMNKLWRKIFETHEEYHEFEKTNYQKLEVELKSQNYQIPKSFPDSEVRRYLQSCEFNLKKTVEAIRKNVEWREKNIPVQITERIKELLNCGFLYIHGRDNNYRPIMVVNAGIYMKLKEKYSFDEWVNCVICFMEYTVNEMLIPGQVENWNIITDLGGFSAFFLPDDLKKILGILVSNYRCRLYRNFIIGMSTFLRGIWAILKNFFDESTVLKIRFLSSDTMSQIFENINPEQVEEHFAGKAKDLEYGKTKCFPPIMPSCNYETDNQPSSSTVDESQYKQLYLQGKVEFVHEYFRKKWIQEQAEEEMNKRIELELEKQNQIKNDEILNYQENHIIKNGVDLSNSDKKFDFINFDNIDEEFNDIKKEFSSPKYKKLKENIVFLVKDKIMTNFSEIYLNKMRTNSDTSENSQNSAENESNDIELVKSSNSNIKNGKNEKNSKNEKKITYESKIDRQCASGSGGCIIF